jgi:hypothetical protein
MLLAAVPIYHNIGRQAQRTRTNALDVRNNVVIICVYCMHVGFIYISREHCQCRPFKAALVKTDSKRRTGVYMMSN